ncbi:MAG: glycosyl hydrolase, partial [Anaerolineaceae bacterium]|nr:glycosyl hydrolase [Anaerolineaceae bacterium]
AYIFYFTHPEVVGMAPEGFVWTYAARRTSLQAARLELEGGQLVCRRDALFDFNLAPGVEE